MAALVAAMLKKDKVGFARFRASKLRNARLVALLPQAHLADATTGATVLPCGLHLVFLPFAEDVRDVAKDETLAVGEFTESELGAARDLVASLRLPPAASPVGTICNPASHTHYSYLQALAVQTDEVEPTVDGTLPDADWLEGANPQMEAFRAAFELPELAEQLDSTAAGKRQKTASAPRLKAPAPEPGDVAAVMALYEAGTLASLTIPKLKDAARGLGLALGGKKDDLVARIHDYCARSAKEDANLAAMRAATE
jgi:ATP-dependent DNA helicase 2 subunit 1